MYRKAGDGKAQKNLGVLYLNGWGNQRNYAEALKWFLKASAKKVPEAFWNLGTMHREGLGVPKDIPKATNYFTLAIKNGYSIIYPKL